MIMKKNIKKLTPKGLIKVCEFFEKFGFSRVPFLQKQIERDKKIIRVEKYQNSGSIKE